MQEPQRAGRDGTLRRVVELFGPYRGRVSLVAATIVLTSLLGVVNPYLTREVFDNALFVEGGPDLDLLTVLVAAMIAVTLVAAGIGVWQTYLTNVLGNRVMQDLRDRLFAHLQRMQLAFFTATRTGEIQSRLGSDVSGVQSVVTDTASSVLSTTVTVASSLVAMLLLSWQLTLVSLALLPLFVVLQVRVGRVRRRIATSTQESVADLTTITEESLSVSGVLLSKVFDRREREVERYRAENAKQAGLQVRQTMTGQSFFAVVQAFFTITPALIYLVAGYTITGGDTALTAGTLVAFTTLQTRLLFPIIQLLRVALDVQTSLALFTRIFGYLDLEPQITDAPGALEVDKDAVSGEVAYEHVWFRYPEDPIGPLLHGTDRAPDAAGDGGTAGGEEERWILSDLSLDIRAGQLAALVGPSGAGKTTTSYLVPRLYDVDRGRVTVDGHDVRDLTLSSLAEMVGMVTQESYLFHASIRDNLRYAKADATDEELAAACRAANIHDRIMAFDEGYDTIVGERGYRLSGGEKQRVAIARVILKDPRLLILDEATSALDTTSERLVQAALEPLMKGRTTIAIAHRLSTILAADVIFVLDAGHLVEQGTHSELLAREGLYAQLYNEQFGGGEVEATCEDGVVLRSGRVVTTAGTP